MTQTGSSKAGGSRNLLPLVSLAVAGLSLGAAAWQGYLNSRNLEIVQRDLGRRELVRVCRDVIEAYFSVKLAVEKSATLRGDRPAAEVVFEPRAAVNRFAALGTYLANFQGEVKRAEYTALSRELQDLAKSSPTLKAETLEAAFAKADGMFAKLNDDCVRSSHFETR